LGSRRLRNFTYYTDGNSATGENLALLHKGDEMFLLGVQKLGDGQVVLEAVNGDVVLRTILVLLADKGLVGKMTLAILDKPGGLVDNSPDCS
jgi:type V secretory pathway adhesin AidA